MPLQNPNIYEIKQGGGFFSLFGLIFMIPGIAIIIAGLFPEAFSSGNDFSPFIAIPFGSIFLIAGTAILIGRRGLIIDRSKGTLLKWWGLPRPLVKTVHTLADFSHVLATKEIRKSKNSTYEVFPIYLGSEQSKSVKILEKRNTAQSRKEGENIAKFLSLPIHDKTSGSLRKRAVNSLDESLKDQYAKGSLTNRLPNPPKNQKSKIEYDAETLTIQTPKRKVSPFLLIPIILFIGFESVIFMTVILPLIKEMLETTKTQ